MSYLVACSTLYDIFTPSITARHESEDRETLKLYGLRYNEYSKLERERRERERATQKQRTKYILRREVITGYNEARIPRRRTGDT